MKQALGSDMDFRFVAENHASGGYKKIFDRIFPNFCLFLYQEHYKDLFEDYQSKTTNPVAFNTCPYPAENKSVSTSKKLQSHFQNISREASDGK